ncbi:TPA: hypothetical protein ACGPQK_002708 [Pseudomonas aeruginosa]
MSSTQLIEQCATRLRGIVEALDNIHDNTPHRWSTDLDDVHSSAESLLAMINDQASNQADLAQPSPKCTTCGGVGMVDDGEITCSEAGIPYENGPVKCVKDCPSCKALPSPGNAEARQCVNCRHIGINDAADYAACHYCRWAGPEPDEDKCPGCGSENCMAAVCPECGGRYDLVAEANITAQAGQVPQAWLDVQAERRRQITTEGWTPEHDDEHNGGELADAAACYALSAAGWSTYAARERWPWPLEWWKPSTARRDLVKACALALAEIERLDRAAASQGGPSDA